MIRRPPRSTRTDTLFPYTTLFRSVDKAGAAAYERIIRPAQYRWPGWIVRCPTQAEGAIAALANEPWPDGGPLDQAQITTACMLRYVTMAAPELLGRGRFPLLEALSRTDGHRLGYGGGRTCRPRWS